MPLNEAHPALATTLNELKITPGFTASELLDRLPGVAATAINQRLEDLRGLGLVRRERDSRCWRYFPV